MGLNAASRGVLASANALEMGSGSADVDKAAGIQHEP